MESDFRDAEICLTAVSVEMYGACQGEV